MPLFEIAVIEHPKKKKDEELGMEKLILGPIPVISRDAQSAAISVVMDNATKLKDADRTRLEVLVRPFGKSQ